MAAPAADNRRDVGRELDRRIAVALHLQLLTTELRCGHGRWIGWAAVLGIVEALSALTGRIAMSAAPCA